jgi:hypothetical protein
LKVNFDDSKTSSTDIEKALAKGGINTPNVKAEEEDLKKVSTCCKEEKAEEKSEMK